MRPQKVRAASRRLSKVFGASRRTHAQKLLHEQNASTWTARRAYRPRWVSHTAEPLWTARNTYERSLERETAPKSNLIAAGDSIAQLWYREHGTLRALKRGDDKIIRSQLLGAFVGI